VALVACATLSALEQELESLTLKLDRVRRVAEPHLIARGEAEARRGGMSPDSWAAELAGWLRKLPEELRGGTEKILACAAAAGASLKDLATITAHALAQWQADHPDEDDDGFPDRYLQIGTTFGGAGVIRGDLTPECAAAVTAVLEALGKKAGPEDDRTEKQRFHDALQLAWAPQPRVCRPGARACPRILLARYLGGIGAGQKKTRPTRSRVVYAYDYNAVLARSLPEGRIYRYQPTGRPY
jgi:hypothetical protein